MSLSACLEAARRFQCSKTVPRTVLCQEIADQITYADFGDPEGSTCGRVQWRAHSLRILAKPGLYLPPCGWGDRLSITVVILTEPKLPTSNACRWREPACYSYTHLRYSLITQLLTQHRSKDNELKRHIIAPLSTTCSSKLRLNSSSYRFRSSTYRRYWRDFRALQDIFQLSRGWYQIMKLQWSAATPQMWLRCQDWKWKHSLLSGYICCSWWGGEAKKSFISSMDLATVWQSSGRFSIILIKLPFPLWLIKKSLFCEQDSGWKDRSIVQHAIMHTGRKKWNKTKKNMCLEELLLNLWRLWILAKWFIKEKEVIQWRCQWILLFCSGERLPAPALWLALIETEVRTKMDSWIVTFWDFPKMKVQTCLHFFKETCASRPFLWRHGMFCSQN